MLGRCGHHVYFFFNDPAPPEIYPLSLPDALPISGGFRHRLEVREHGADLRLDVPAHQLHGRRIERHLAGQVDGVAGAHRLRVGADRLRGALGVDGLAAHRLLLLRGIHPRRSLSASLSASLAASLSAVVPERACPAMVRVTRVTSAMPRVTRTRRARWRRSRTRSSKVSTAVSLSCSSMDTWSMLVSVLAIAAATAASTPVRFTA